MQIWFWLSLRSFFQDFEQRIRQSRVTIHVEMRVAREIKILGIATKDFLAVDQARAGFSGKVT